MVEFINQLTGTVMYVAEERAAEYAAAGHKQISKILQKIHENTVIFSSDLCL